MLIQLASYPHPPNPQKKAPFSKEKKDFTSSYYFVIDLNN